MTVDNPLHTFLQFMSGNIPDQVSLGDGRWFTIALYWLLLIGSLSVAYLNWPLDPRQHTVRDVGVCGMRLLMAGMWCLGTLWKLPLPVSSGFQFWTSQIVKFSSFHPQAVVMQLVLDHIAQVQPLVYLLEIYFTASLMLGLMVRLTGVVAALFTLNLLIGLYNDPTEWPWTYVGIICARGMFATNHAGRSLGLDNLLAKRLIPGLRDGLAARALLIAS
jgi:uncharacterized membrane protein YphA (DoxX/SURF4 family)